MAKAKVRVYELARELGISSKEALDGFKKLGIELKTNLSTVTADEAQRLRDALKPKARAKKVPSPSKKEEMPAKKRPPARRKTRAEKKEKEAKKEAPPKREAPPKKEEAPPEGVEAGLEAPVSKKETKEKKEPSRRREEARRDVSSPFIYRPRPRPKRRKRKKREEEFLEEQEVLPGRVDLDEGVAYLPEAISVKELAALLQEDVDQVVDVLLKKGVAADAKTVMPYDLAKVVAEEFGFEVRKEGEEALEVSPEEEEALEPRAPVVTVMGHVDHGKTTLLDYIRRTNVAEREAGGITQHIGAYRVTLPEGEITFIDTPGHHAFTTMRARGAQVTDIVVLVVAADDGVMPQTVEAINHAKAAGVPIIVAINKIDKPNANPERVKQELAKYGLIPEEWGGDTIFVEISAKQGTNVDELLEMIILQAEMLELKANPNKPASGTVLESKLDNKRGPVATLLVKEGTLRQGDALVAGLHWGKVRAMFDHQGRQIKEAGPSVPVEVLGLQGVPMAGEPFMVVENEKKARQISEERQEKARDVQLERPKVSLEELMRQLAEGETREFRILLKADVQGSLEAIKDSLNKLSTEEVKVNVVHAGVGGITESDVMLASASRAVIIGFNVRPDSQARKAAEREGVEIRLYRVIYDLLDDVKKAMEGLLEPEYEEVVLGRAEVRQVFQVPKVGKVAGCYVLEGSISRNAKVRLIRDGVVVYEGGISSLKRFKDDVREVAAGYECGIGLTDFNDIKEGDVIEAYELKEVPRTL